MTVASPAAYLLKRKIMLLKSPPAEGSGTASIQIVFEGDEDPSIQNLLEQARSLNGDLKPKQLYVSGVTDDSSPRFLVILAREPARKLAARASGLAHHATVWGAQLSALLSATLSLSEYAAIQLVFSSSFVHQLQGINQQYFVVGLLERSASLKMKESALFETFERKPLKIWCDSLSEESRLTGEQLAGAMLVTRSLVNMPSNILNPESYEVFVRELIRRECDAEADPNHVSVEVFHREKLAAEGCGLINAVGQGSDIPPRIIRLSYFPKIQGKPIKHVSLVGKGITFDSGGLDIKGSNFMRNMKKDMGGSAAALGVFLAVARQKLPVRLSCYLALAENMVSGRSMRPGDVYRAKNGISVEIDNTDAEGRLVLADALCYAVAEKPDWLIDFATLTGAARTALGPSVDAVFCTDSAIETLIVDVGRQLGDWVWPLPFVEDYESWLDSSVADVTNSASSGHAGAITAAQFLKKFVGQSQWTHVDTYMWADKPTDLTQEAGATAKCVRLMTHTIGLWATQA